MQLIWALASLILLVIGGPTELIRNEFHEGDTASETLDVYTFPKPDDSTVELQLIRTSTIKAGTGTKIGLFISNVGPQSLANVSQSRFSKISLPTMITSVGPRWYIAVSNTDIYSYAIRFCNNSCPNVCPNKCNQHGACDIEKKTCACDGVEEVVAYANLEECLPAVDLIAGLPVLYFVSCLLGLILLVIALPVTLYFVSKAPTADQVAPKDSKLKHGLLDTMIR